MPAYYTYFISSLPMLHFGMKPPFSFDSFIQRCQRLIPDEDIEILKKVSRTGEYTYDKTRQPTLEKWYDFDTALRNELAKIRAAHRHIDPSQYLRSDGYTDTSAARLAISAHRNPSILEAEKALDQARWNALEELIMGHYFDIDFLIVYAVKLLILERWTRIRSADALKELEEELQKYVGNKDRTHNKN